jgi:hypothetical protein
MRGQYIFGAAAMVAFCSGAKELNAATAAQDYSRIPLRNLFGLHEPVQVQPEIVKPQLPKIVLNGVATLGGKLAFLKVQYPPKPGEPQPGQIGEQSLTLSEGQREGGIEMLEINDKAGTIRVNNSGTEMTVGFDKDASKVAKTPPAGQPGAPNVAGAGRAMNAGTSGFQRMIPTRTGRQVPAGAEPPLPPTPAPTGQTLLQKQSAPGDKPLTPEEQAILKELEQAAQGNPQQPR